MGCGRIPDGDSLFRHTIHPISFRKDIFVWAKFIRLQEEPDGSLLTSIAWQRYLPTVRHIHQCGCRIALRINDRKKAKGQLTDKNRHFYCGAYRLKAGSVRALVSAHQLDEISSADVIHHIEEGEIAHTDLRIFPKPGVVNIQDTKTAIVDRLWNLCSGPLTHRCEYDSDVAQYPDIDLSTPPGGAYSDTRSCLHRLWCLTRFHARTWFWRTFQQNAIEDSQ